MNNRKFAAAMMVKGLLAAALVPGTALAQAEPAADEPASGGDIVVTAQRYAQRLQDVPGAINAISGDSLEQKNIRSIEQLQYSVPGLSTFEYGPGKQYVQLRGVSNTIGASTVGVYFDETPLAMVVQGSDFSVRLLDMERVEVLKGPQATLYGEGSMGGTIRYIPTAPDLARASGSVSADLNTTNGGDTGYSATGVLNIPLVTDKLALRVVGGIERVGGFIDNSVSGESNVNSTKIGTIRATLLAEPTDRFNISLTGLYQRSDQGNQNFGVDDSTDVLVPTRNLDRYALFQGKASYDLDFAELVGIASYIDRNSDVTSDVSAYFAAFLPPGSLNTVALPTASDLRIFSSELRLVSQSDGPLRWTIGAAYRNNKRANVQNAITDPVFPYVFFNVSDRLKSRSYSVYGELTYEITDRLSVIGGVRYFHDTRAEGSVLTLFGASESTSGKDKFHSVNPRFNINYKLSDNSLFYVNAAKGFRSGGINSVAAPAPESYGPDEIWTYEGGTKQQLFDKRLTIDASVYYSDWKDVQSYGFVGPLTFTANTGVVKGWGVDVAVAARPLPGVTISGSYGWNNLEFKQATGDKAVGDPIDGAVRETYSASLDLREPVGDAEAFLTVDYQHAAPGQITLRQIDQIIPRPGRDLVNATVGADLGDIEIALYVNNLFNERAPLVIGPFGVNFENLLQTPRVVGVRARASF